MGAPQHGSTSHVNVAPSRPEARQRAQPDDPMLGCLAERSSADQGEAESEPAGDFLAAPCVFQSRGAGPFVAAPGIPTRNRFEILATEGCGDGIGDGLAEGSIVGNADGSKEGQGLRRALGCGVG
jgi:hypothetical protein